MPSMAILTVDNRVFRIELERDEQGNITATCPKFPGCTVKTESIQTALAEIQKLIQFALDEGEKE
jgi:predicted RNase H-like HicB family nuclease